MSICLLFSRLLNFLNKETTNKLKEEGNLFFFVFRPNRRHKREYNFPILHSCLGHAANHHHKMKRLVVEGGNAEVWIWHDAMSEAFI